MLVLTQRHTQGMAHVRLASEFISESVNGHISLRVEMPSDIRDLGAVESLSRMVTSVVHGDVGGVLIAATGREKRQGVS